MNRRLRLLLAIIILAVSFSILFWGYWPNPREVRDRNIPPAEMQLPTPISLHFYLIPAV
ncbi:MAG: hypothetical protein IH589_05915 [Anaerolineales bacterium]|nr:hypothetical protein [Anaerolineales bacterium]